MIKSYFKKIKSSHERNKCNNKVFVTLAILNGHTLINCPQTLKLYINKKKN